MKNLLVILFAASFAFASCGEDNAVSNAVNEATEAASDVANAAGDAASAAGDMAGDAANAAGNMAGDAVDGAKNAVGGMSAMSALTSTVSAVKEAGGITKLSPDVAASNVEGWISTLGGMEGTDGIVGNLKTLKTELTKGNIDGSIVGPILVKLADETEKLGKGNVAVNGLASALRMGGEKLSK
ncbi:MAG: hypothetical protein AB8F78_07495 [Saprospiraceae bacterium]